MTISREFFFQLPIAVCLLMLTTVILVRASAPSSNEASFAVALRVTDSLTELASE